MSQKNSCLHKISSIKSAKLSDKKKSLVDEIDRIYFFDFENKTISLTISLGVTSPPLGEKIKENEFVRRADKALYRAKAKGKNITCAFHPKPLPKKSIPRRAEAKAQS